jgi:uncharacterized protein
VALFYYSYICDMSDEKQNENSNPVSDRERMRAQLNETHTWPSDFMFKFIVPKGNENEAALRAIFGLKSKMKMRESSTGKYRSFTILDRVTGADEVFERYEAAAKIPGIIAL